MACLLGAKFLTMHQLKTLQFLPIDLDEAWDFFSSPANLQQITPPEMNLVPVTPVPGRMYPGMIVVYKVKPIAGIPFTWVTEITHCRERSYFVDEQRIGPYRLWHHEHHFREVAGGVEMTDIVSYRLPLARLGVLLHGLFVKGRVEAIFEYRRQRLIELFGEWAGPA